MTPLQQLQHAFAKFLDQIQPRGDSIIISEYADKLEIFKFQEEYVIKLAEAVMHCEPFAVLPFEDKWLFFRHFWAAFYSIERIYSSIEYFGYNLDDSRHLVTSKFAVDSNTKWTISEIPIEQSMKFVELIQPMEINLIENLAKPLKRLQVTRFEIVYLLAEMLWSVHEVKGISDYAKAIRDDILEQISSELHNFYIFDLKLYNYAARHARLIRLIPISENQVQLYKDYLAMAKISNLFEYNLYESELVK
uniref:NR LBD domain-containing protein n=1 Tax=Acrobeloides nanus TaxID=290746 RepID=A0A914BYU5_9BILA